MKKLLIVTLMMVFASAMAYATPITFNIDQLYDWGRLYQYNGGPNTYTALTPNPAYFGGGTDTPVGTSFAADTVNVGDGEEDTWGVATISSITNITGTQTIWSRGTQELTFIFYGFDDNYLSSPDTNPLSPFFGSSTLASTGGRIQVWLDAAGPFFDGTLGTAGRTAANGYTGVTEGVLALDLIPVGVDANGHTLLSHFDFASLSGGGSMFLGTSGAGIWDQFYDTNTQQYGADFSFTYTVRNNADAAQVGDWTVRGDGGGEGNVVPEPASMAIFGIGLLGMGARFRRKKTA